MGDPSACVSSRIQDMLQHKSEIKSEIEASKTCWTEMRSRCDDDADQPTNMEIFERLQNHPKWGRLFRRGYYSFHMGEKIAEGAQAEIFNCEHDEGAAPLVWKVFKRQFPLLDLQRQWPHGMFENANLWSYGKDNARIIWGILLLDDGRFAIEMLKYWSDLRKFIDEKMQQNNNQNPPFTKEVAKLIMWDIAKGMRNLHRDEILHRDLKAANVLIDNSFRLLRGNIFDAHKNNFACRVADFECSVGGQGHGFLASS